MLSFKSRRLSRETTASLRVPRGLPTATHGSLATRPTAAQIRCEPGTRNVLGTFEVMPQLASRPSGTLGGEMIVAPRSIRRRPALRREGPRSQGSHSRQDQHRSGRPFRRASPPPLTSCTCPAPQAAGSPATCGLPRDPAAPCRGRCCDCFGSLPRSRRWGRPFGGPRR